MSDPLRPGGGWPLSPGVHPPGHDAPGSNPVVEDLFRRSAGRMVAGLTRRLGAEHLELVQECVQDALLGALKRWPVQGLPTDPQGWLYRTAWNRALDRLRRSRRWESVLEGGPAPDPTVAPAEIGGSPLDDDELALVFLCCHPRLSSDQAVALTLHTAGGLSAREIASAFRVKEATMAQRIVRAKRALREVEDPVALPSPSELTARLPPVLRALYLIFNEGYAAAEGESWVRRELCAEAIRLTEILSAHPRTAGPEVDAHLALFLLQGCRLPARVATSPLPSGAGPPGRSDASAHGGGAPGPAGPDGVGDPPLALLQHQDRGRWDPAMRDRGLAHLERAGTGDVLTPVHLEAGIASCHAVAPSFQETDWARVARCYELLHGIAPSPVVTLNRAVAVTMAEGPGAGLAVLETLAEGDAGPGDHQEPAVRGWILSRLGRRLEAAQAYRQALGRGGSLPVRRHLETALRRLDGERDGRPSPP